MRPQVGIGRSRTCPARMPFVSSVLVLMSPLPLAADVMPVTAALVQVHAAAGSEVADLIWYFPAHLTAIDDEYRWSLPGPVTLLGSNGVTPLGVVRALEVTIRTDPSVALDFDVAADNALTTFNLTATPITFAPLRRPSAFAHSTLKVRDANRNGSARATGLLTGPGGLSRIYVARYNGTSAWAWFFSPLIVMSAGATSEAEEGRPMPPPGGAPGTAWEKIPGDVSRLDAQFAFTLTANDSASGASLFRLLPAADFNTDGDVDLDDFQHFQSCYNGPNQAPARSGCGDADLDGDGDVDLTDYRDFQACYNGANRPPGCP